MQLNECVGFSVVCVYVYLRPCIVLFVCEYKSLCLVLLCLSLRVLTVCLGMMETYIHVVDEKVAEEAIRAGQVDDPVCTVRVCECIAFV